MIIKRPFWEELINDAWKKRTIIWLMGVRRVGKTSLCKSLANIEYFDCELPSIRLQMKDPETFLESKRGKRIVIDEIHRLENPSELLKIAADHYKDVHIIATGSSTLGASKKFRDTLTGRKIEIWLTPMLIEEIALFKNNDIRHRFMFGGLPSFFAEATFPHQFFQEWIDAYWAKDIQDIFSIGKRNAFQKFAELLFASSGGLFEATRYGLLCEVGRATIDNYLNVLEETFVVHVIRPYASHKPMKSSKHQRSMALTQVSLTTLKAAQNYAKMILVLCGNTAYLTNCTHTYKHAQSTTGAIKLVLKLILLFVVVMKMPYMPLNANFQYCQMHQYQNLLQKILKHFVVIIHWEIITLLFTISRPPLQEKLAIHQ